MSTIPPGMWTNPEDFPEAFRSEQEEGLSEAEIHGHGPDRGHEAVQHGDNVDYVDGAHRHWWNLDHWDKH
jgi:hypothetical protein